jgi:hypothetical protein
MCTAGSVFVGPHSGQCCVRIVAGLDATGHIRQFRLEGFASLSVIGIMADSAGGHPPHGAVDLTGSNPLAAYGLRPEWSLNPMTGIKDWGQPLSVFHQGEAVSETRVVPLMVLDQSGVSAISKLGSSSSTSGQGSLPLVPMKRMNTGALRTLPFPAGRYHVNRRYGGQGERTPRGTALEVGYLPLSAQTSVVVRQGSQVSRMTNITGASFL